MNNETHAALVCCGSRDEMMLPLFVKKWREKFSHIPLVLANDEVNPVLGTLGLPCVPLRWGPGVGQRMVTAMLRTGADIVAKFDVDTFLTDVDWLFSPYADQRIASVGLQLAHHPGQYYGLAYSVRRSVLIDLEVTCRTCAMRGNDDDTAICNAVLLREPNSVYLYPNMLARRSDTWLPSENVFAVHCGSYGRNAAARGYAMEEMSRLHSLAAGLTSAEIYPSIYHADGSPKQEVWFTLATLPHRVGSTKQVIESLLSQTYPIAGIVVAMASGATRTGDAFSPADVQSLTALSPKVHICSMPDHGPATKYLCAKELILASAIIITVDDDHTYSPQLVERMLLEHQPNTILANCVNQIGGIVFSEAFAAVLWTHTSLHLPSLLALLQYCEHHIPAAILADDWLVGKLAALRGVSVSRMRKPVPPRPTLSAYDSSSLHQIGTGHLPRYREVAEYFAAHPYPVNHKEI